jgi:hypothetical protein
MLYRLSKDNSCNHFTYVNIYLSYVRISYLDCIFGMLESAVSVWWVYQLTQMLHWCLHSRNQELHAWLQQRQHILPIMLVMAGATKSARPLVVATRRMASLPVRVVPLSPRNMNRPNTVFFSSFGSTFVALTKAWMRNVLIYIW